MLGATVQLDKNLKPIAYIFGPGKEQAAEPHLKTRNREPQLTHCYLGSLDVLELRPKMVSSRGWRG